MNSTLLPILIVLAAGVLAWLGLRRFLGKDRSVDERLTAYATLPELERRSRGARSRRWLVRARLWLNRTLSFLSSAELEIQLVSAGWPVTVTEFVILRLAATVLSFLLVWWISQFVLAGLGVAILVYLVPGIVLKYSTNRRRQKFSRQLVDVLVLITGAVRAGFSLLQAMEVVANEIAAPASEEFKRVLQEVGLGRPLSAALGNLAIRMDNKDLNLLITAINIQYQVGGNLTTMLAAVTETIRERVRLFAEARALTSQQRLSSYIISLLPIIVAAALFFLNPEYMRGLFSREYWYIPAIAGLMMLTGFILIQRMIKVDI
jgi:tight adherence protein B